MVHFNQKNTHYTILQILQNLGMQTRQELRLFFPSVTQNKFTIAVNELIENNLVCSKTFEENGKKVKYLHLIDDDKIPSIEEKRPVAVLRWLFTLKNDKNEYIYADKIKYATTSLYPHALIVGYNGVMHIIYIPKDEVDETVTLIKELDVRDDINSDSVRRILVVDDSSYIEEVKSIKGVANIVQVDATNNVKILS